MNNTTLPNKPKWWQQWTLTEWIWITITIAITIGLAALWFNAGAFTNARATQDTFTINTDAGTATCVVYVAESASIDCTWPTP